MARHSRVARAIQAVVLTSMAALVLVAAGCGGGSDEGDEGVAGSLGRVGLATDGATATLTAAIELEDDGEARVSIDWGDGFREERPFDGGEAELRAEHEFEAAGEYEVTLTLGAGEDADTVVIVASIDEAAFVRATSEPTSTPTATPSATAPASTSTATPTVAATAAPTVVRTATPAPTRTATPAPTATATATVTPTPPPNEPPTVTITNATSGVRMDGTIEFSAADPEGGDLEITVDYGDGTSEAITAPGNDFTATHDYDRWGTYAVRIEVSDEAGNSVEASTPLTITARIVLGTTLGPLSVFGSCDAAGTESEFYGAFSALGTSTEFSVDVPANGTSPIFEGAGIVSEFTVDDADQTLPIVITFTLYDNDPGPNDPRVATYNASGTTRQVDLSALSRQLPVTGEGSAASLSGAGCSVEMAFQVIAEINLD